jgi:hypothetical protein
VEPALKNSETAMSIARCLFALVIAAVLGGCASVGAGAMHGADVSGPISAAEEVALLRLAEKVEAAAVAAPAPVLRW